jgi:hypothetical protein
MRVWAIVLALSIVSQTVCSQPAEDAISRLKACFQLERALQAECLENLSRELTDKKNQNSAEAAARSWIVSETTSPLDYSPMITATTSSQSVAKDAPATFMIRCRGQRTDTDGRTAMFKDDAVRFLRSLPDGGRIIVSVFDSQGVAHEASFQLTGLDAIRQKIAAVCKWTPAADKVAPAGR